VVAPAGVSPGWLWTRWDRLNGPQRIAGIDLARGLAVLGMLAAHLLWIDDFSFAEPGSWLAIVDGRSSILFATLAGVSIGLVTGGSTPLSPARLRTARLRLVVRALALWIIGILLIATGVPVYVILPAYAILFLLATALVSLSTHVLIPLAVGLAVVMPFVQVLLDELPVWNSAMAPLLAQALGWHYPFPVWIAFVVAGLAVARAGILRTRVQMWVLGIGLALAVIGYGAAAATGADLRAEFASYWGAVWTARPHSSGVLEVIGSGGFALAVIAMCVLLCRTVLTWAVLPLRAVGAMPLTAYIAQIVAWAIIATVLLGDPGDLRAFRDLEPFWPLALAIIAGATVWALLMGRGPLEWLVDRVAKIAVPTVPRRVERAR
jgi:uncharacterized membrane protein YeiB